MLVRASPYMSVLQYTNILSIIVKLNIVFIYHLINLFLGVYAMSLWYHIGMWLSGKIRISKSEKYNNSVIGKYCSFRCYFPNRTKKISLKILSFSRIKHRTGLIYRFYFNTKYTRFLEVKISKYGNVMTARYIHRDVLTDICRSPGDVLSLVPPRIGREVELRDRSICLVEYNLYTQATEHRWNHPDPEQYNHTRRIVTSIVDTDMRVYVEIDHTGLNRLSGYCITSLDYTSIKIT